MRILWWCLVCYASLRYRIFNISNLLVLIIIYSPGNHHQLKIISHVNFFKMKPNSLLDNLFSSDSIHFFVSDMHGYRIHWYWDTVIYTVSKHKSKKYFQYKQDTNISVLYCSISSVQVKLNRMHLMVNLVWTLPKLTGPYTKVWWLKSPTAVLLKN